MIVGLLRWRPIFRAAWWALLILVGAAVLAVVLHQGRTVPGSFGALGDWIRRGQRALDTSFVEIPAPAIAALGAALSIFLGFRNSSAYDRWWEARKLWGRIVNDSRNWAREVLTFLTPDRRVSGVTTSDLAALQRELVLRHIAWVHALRFHLREQPERLDQLAGLLAVAELDKLSESTSWPNRLMLAQGQGLSLARRCGFLTDHEHVQLDSTLNRLLDHQGGCERIKNTVLPRQYDAIPRVFAWVYAIILPGGLAASLGWLTVIIAPLIGFLFLLIEASGRLVEDPFENKPMDIPISAISTSIERNLKEMLGEERLPEPELARDGYILM